MTAFCGGRRVEPGTICSDGTMSTWKANGQGGPSNGPKPGQSGESTVTESASWNTNTSPVPFRTAAESSASYSGGIPGPAVQETLPFNEAMNYVNELRGKASGGSEADKDRYKNFVNDLRKYTGSKLGTAGSIEDAFRMVLEDAQQSGENVMDLLRKGPGLAGKQGGGSGSGGPTTRRDITYMAESDIDATANAIALELIGRPLDQKEIDRVTKRMRKAEATMPSVTTYSSGGSVTQQGLTSQGREDILREVIAQNPEYEQFQVDTTVLDAMSDFIDRKKEISGG